MKLLDEIHHRLGSKSRIRSLFKDISVHELEKMLERLRDVHQEKLQSRVKEDAKRQKKLDDIAAIHKEMAELGVTLSDLDGITDSGKSTKRRRVVTKHIFQYEDAAGEPVQWEGSTTGRLPKEFQEYLEKTNKKRAECIVK